MFGAACRGVGTVTLNSDGVIDQSTLWDQMPRAVVDVGENLSFSL